LIFSVHPLGINLAYWLTFGCSIAGSHAGVGMMRKLVMAAVAAAVLGAMPAQAVIVSGVLTGGNVQTLGGVFQVTSLSSIAVNSINSVNVLGINERQDFLLTSSLRVFNVNVAPGVTLANTTAVTNASTIQIAAGTRVNSHLIILDPTNTNVGGTSVTGRVTFNTPILGYIFANSGRLTANFPSTNYLGAPGTTYGALHGSLEGGIDAVSFSGKTLTFGMQAGRDVGDYLRVITGVPEPTTWAMLLTGFGLVGLAARRRRPARA
jgi:hypothetical protein